MVVLFRERIRILEPSRKDKYMKELQYGPCGLFCSACGAPDCEGCLSDSVDDWVRQCKFRNCSQEKNITFCCFCNDFPCQELHDFMNDEWLHHSTMEPNLDSIKKHGLEKWLQTQQQEYSCDTCGAGIKWYQKRCTCGRDLDAFEPPAQHNLMGSES